MIVEFSPALPYHGASRRAENPQGARRSTGGNRSNNTLRAAGVIGGLDTEVT